MATKRSTKSNKYTLPSKKLAALFEHLDGLAENKMAQGRPSALHRSIAAEHGVLPSTLTAYRIYQGQTLLDELRSGMTVADAVAEEMLPSAALYGTGGFTGRENKAHIAAAIKRYIESS